MRGEALPELDPETTARKAAMHTMAHATAAELAALVDALPALPPLTDLRPPQIGLVMIRGRIGGEGSPFNAGEATVTRAAVRLETGEVGFSYILGREIAKARHAAIIDALWQTDDWRPKVEAAVLAPLRTAQKSKANKIARRTAATKVEFFTMVRGEDA
jgi:alpha-D-ribose 1-methylphosphonate 5-triphosphate synthase subunit PhnG